MENNKFSIVSIISLLGSYASYFIPFVLDDKLSTREIIIITIFSSAIFLTIFVASVIVTIYKFKYKIKTLENTLETANLKLDILKDESDSIKEEYRHLKTLAQNFQNDDI